MSINITPSIDVSLDVSELTSDAPEDVNSSGSQRGICLSEPKEISAVKREYSIVGDAFYAGVNSGTAPAWLTTLIDSVVGASVANGLTDYDLLVQDVRNAIDSINVAKNTFVEQINFNALVNGIIGSHLTTLNAEYGGKFATIVALETVKVDTESSLALITSDLRSEFSDDINSRITSVESAYAAADQVNADSINALSVAFADQSSGLSGTAEAISTLQTYVGLTAEGDPNGTGMLQRLDSESAAITALTAEVTGEDGYVATAINNLKTSSEAYTDASSAGVQNNFAYNSTLVLGGKYYTSGFGLSASGITQTNDGDTPETAYDSEFWINAESFVLQSPTYPEVTARFNVTSTGIRLGLDNTEATRNEPKGVHNSSSSYNKGDTVTSNGSSYVARQDVPVNTQVSHTAYWQLLASKGVDGVDGVGIQGTAGSGSYIYVTSNSKAWAEGRSSAQRNADFLSASGRAAQQHDSLEYVNQSATVGYSVNYLRGLSSWSGFVHVLDGNQLIKGTVVADSLVTNMVIAEDATFKGTLDVKSAATGGRLEINGNQILVYDTNNALRIKIGQL